MRVLLSFLLILCLLPASPVHARGLGIVAVVNDEMISSLDVEQRMVFALATTKLSNTPEVRTRLGSQIVRALIDERLHMQEAKRLGLTVTEQEVKGAMVRIDQSRQLPAGSFEEFLTRRGVPKETVYAQLRSQIAWSKVVGKELRKKGRVSADEVNREMEQLRQGKEIEEFQISSIVLAVNQPEDEKNVKELAENLVSEIRGGANFEALARQFSAGSAQAVEENQRRWVQYYQLEPTLASEIKDKPTDTVHDPIRTVSGYHIIKRHDKRILNTTRTLDSEVLIKQITMTLKASAPQQEAEVLLEIAREVGKHPGSCEEELVAGTENLEELAFDVAFQRLPFREIQPELQVMLAGLRVGDVSEPYATPEGIHMMMLCERVEMPANLPPTDKVKEGLFQEKLQLEAAKHMRDLRREAFIEVRTK